MLRYYIYLIIFLLGNFAFSTEIESDGNVENVTTIYDFNSINQFNKLTTKSWKEKNVLFKWEVDGGINDSPCVSIENLDNNPNDSAMILDLNLIEGKWYNISGWLKSENLEFYESESIGANYSIIDTWEHISNLKNTWEKSDLTFRYSEGMNIGLRLGYWYGTVTGKAFFDDLSISELHFSNKLNGEFVSLSIEEEDLVGLSIKKLQDWVSNLDDLYIVLKDFTGFIPDKSKKMEIISVRHYPGGLAVAGFPIKWMKEYIRDELIRVIEDQQWSFAMVHEISHNFDLESWNFDAEHFSNFKLCYALEVLNGKVMGPNGYLVGKNVAQIFSTRKNEVLNYFLETGEYYDFNDLITYWFIQIKDIIGWEPFKKTFHDFNLLEIESNEDRVEKYLKFMEILQSNTSSDIFSIIPKEEQKLIIQYLKR